MVIKYYNNPELSYSARKRYGNFSFESFAEETQKSVILGDGATTTIKTSKDNICNYVVIDNTRWFVTSYVYLNGRQVELSLQRDVIGEFGLSGLVGKVERGYTDTFIRNRKELSLNQILKKRILLKPDSKQYGNYSVDNHNNELWGILYFVKPTGINPATGEPYPDKLNINIPAFAPNYVNYPLLDDGTKVISQTLSGVGMIYDVRIPVSSRPVDEPYVYYKITTRFNFVGSNYAWTISHTIKTYYRDKSFGKFNGWTINTDLPVANESLAVKLLNSLADNIAYGIRTNPSNGITFPELPDLKVESLDYNNIIVKDGNNFYKFSSTDSIDNGYGTVDKNSFESHILSFDNTSVSIESSSGQTTTYNIRIYPSEELKYSLTSRLEYYIRTYKRTQLSPVESGSIEIDLKQQLVDEPYSILVFPLFDVKISGTRIYNIQRSQAFMIFNTVIQYLSGDNPYLIDAQIYPYCPILTDVACQLVVDENAYPFFKIQSNTYTHEVKTQLLPLSDIKKEYIEREYSIISPEKSGKFTFNFYDYVNTVNDYDGKNKAELGVIIKTALKPFSIVSYAVITPELNSLMGITYSSDLRGCCPTSNGFECSLSSNQFETYKRQNSNFQQIFALQKEELQVQHAVERVNDATSTIINTITAESMGAIAGASMADTGLLNVTGSKIAGAVAGGVASGTIVGGAMIAQSVGNAKLRNYEEYLQQANYDLQIGTIKNLPNAINRISSFNEIILRDFWYVIEVYECSNEEKEIVNNFIERYGYGIGVIDYVYNYYKEGWFIRSTLTSSNLQTNLHVIAGKELMGGIYYYEQI